MSATCLKGRNFLKLLDFSPLEIEYLLTLSAELKAERKSGTEKPRLAGKAIALIFEKNSTRTRTAFEVAAFHQGAHTTYLAPTATHIGSKESPADTARVLGSLYDAIQYRGHSQALAEELALHSKIPVYNGLTDEFHPTQMLADLLTMKECCAKPWNDIKLVYLGDGANNTANSLMVGTAKLGIDFRLASPPNYRPNSDLVETCRQINLETGGKLNFYDSAAQAATDADFVYTDVWLSMGQPAQEWNTRIEAFLPYRVDTALMAVAHPECKFLHCLPAFHDDRTETGQRFLAELGLMGLEVSHDVFESSASVVFQQSENRLHTIKALMVATLGDL